MIRPPKIFHSVVSEIISVDNCSQQDGEIQSTFLFIFSYPLFSISHKGMEERVKIDQISVLLTLLFIQNPNILIINSFFPTKVLPKLTCFITSYQPIRRTNNNHIVEHDISMSTHSSHYSYYTNDIQQTPERYFA